MTTQGEFILLFMNTIRVSLVGFGGEVMTNRIRLDFAHKIFSENYDPLPFFVFFAFFFFLRN